MTALDHEPTASRTPTRVWHPCGVVPLLAEVVRAEGGDPERPGRQRSAVLEVAAQALELGAARLRPAVATRRLTVTGRRHNVLELREDRIRITGPLRTVLAGSREIVAIVCTIGPEVERDASRLFATDPALAVALDAVGSAALQRVSDEARRRVERSAATRSWHATAPVSPGGPGWPVAPGQRELFSLVAADRIGVALSPDAMMTPRKSVSFVLGIGPSDASIADPCTLCERAERCRFRPCR